MTASWQRLQMVARLRKICERAACVLLVSLSLLSLTGCAGAASEETSGMAPGVSPTQAAIEATLGPALTLLPVTQAPPATQAAPTPMPGIPESRLLVVEWPAKVREGDASRIRLALEVDDQGRLTPTVSQPGNVIRGEPVAIPNLYDTHRVLARAQLSIAGMQISPQEEQEQDLLPGQAADFTWSVRPQEVGKYQGQITLDLQFIPRTADRALQESHARLPTQLIELQVVNFLGLGGAAARLVGSLGTLVGSVLGLDNVIPWLWRRLRRRGD